MVIMLARVKDSYAIPGRVYRDLDGTLVHLVAVDHDLCSWVALADASERRQVTHRENFRRRFRSFEGGPPPDWKKKAA